MSGKGALAREDSRTSMFDGQPRQSAESSESKVHSFIVKIWLEEVGDKNKRRSWHGHITHVPGGERRYVKTMADVTDFIAASVGHPGAPRTRSIRRWFMRLSA